FAAHVGHIHGDCICDLPLNCEVPGVHCWQHLLGRTNVRTRYISTQRRKRDQSVRADCGIVKIRGKTSSGWSVIQGKYWEYVPGAETQAAGIDVLLQQDR